MIFLLVHRITEVKNDTWIYVKSKHELSSLPDFYNMVATCSAVLKMIEVRGAPRATLSSNSQCS
jgi:hypothetical protein